MPRARDPNRDKAFEIWKQHKGEITNREIALRLEIDEKKIAVWKQRDKWNVIQQTEVNVVQQNRNRGAPVGNSNAKGNKGNKMASPPKQNSNALKHGLFAKNIPKETLDIIDSIMEDSIMLEILWDQIKIQYAAIIRAQKIMFVSGKDEMIKELKKAKYEYYPRSKEDGGGFEKSVTEEEYEFQFAWDRQATFMNAQSRAMSELRSLIKQFDEMAHADDERRLKLEGMQLAIDKGKAEIEKIQGDKGASEDWVAALKEVAEKRKKVKANE